MGGWFVVRHPRSKLWPSLVDLAPVVVEKLTRTQRLTKCGRRRRHRRRRRRRSGDNSSLCFFSKTDELKIEYDLGFTHLTEHAINTKPGKPIRQRHRRTPQAFAGEEKKAIEKLQAQGVIRESSSPWASPILLVRKKDGSVRPVVDYRAVNKLCTVDAFPIPKIDDCLDSLGGSTLFSTVDMTSGYLQVPVKESDIQKTAFITKHGLFEFTSMPFGLSSSSATFQRVMELALKGLQWTVCLIYIDDCIVFANSFQEHAQRLATVLERFRAANLKLKPNKCSLLKPEVTFLGYRVSKDGILPDPNNIAKILQWKEPVNVTEVKQFLGTCTYYRRFIHGFSRIAKPLFDITKRIVRSFD